MKMKRANLFYCQKLYYEMPTVKSRNGISIVPDSYNIHSLRFTDYKRKGHIFIKKIVSPTYFKEQGERQSGLLCFEFN